VRPVTEILWGERDDAEGGVMEFRLTYAGLLRPDTREENKRAAHKHEIRKYFHPQLRRLWEDRSHLRDTWGHVPDGALMESVPEDPHLPESLAQRFQRCGYRFVPLVTADLAVACSIHVLFLRPEPPGRIIQSGDIDNRIKTLFDGLRMPREVPELGGYLTPSADEDPFYCLVENDDLITSLSVETDTLLEPLGPTMDRADARLVITVNLRPTRPTWVNARFA
jgi:hypothetical protein